VAALASRFTTWDGAAASARCRAAAAIHDVLDRDAPEEMREALEHGARLLDIGRSIDYYSRCEHTASAVLASDLSGFSHRGIALIAAVVERAGGDRRGSRRLGVLITRDDRRAVDRAGMVLRIADELTRRAEGTADIGVVRKERRGPVVVSLPASQGWQPGEVGKRFRRVFGRSLVIEPEAGGRPSRGVTLDLK
jgi:hypothetical protein